MILTQKTLYGIEDLKEEIGTIEEAKKVFFDNELENRINELKESMRLYIQYLRDNIK